MRKIIFLLPPAALLLLACGGGSSSSSNTGGTPPSGGPAVSAPANPPQVVTVSAGAATTGVNIAVGSPSATPALNAESLGVTPIGGGGAAFNSGDIIHRGATQRILLFGPGLGGTSSVAISGPPGDFTISNMFAVTSQSNTPGISFDVLVSPTASLGAHTVLLKNQASDITTFTGGLEVQP